MEDRVTELATRESPSSIFHPPPLIHTVTTLTITPLFAFGFVSPALLWGLALGAAPVIIHLLNRRKYRETDWAAMRFLLDAVRKNSRRLRIEQIVLLTVRTLILLLVCLALAEPLVDELGAFFLPSQPSHKVIVIDASASMGLYSRETSVFERAKQAGRAIVERSRQGDVFNLVRLSNIPPAVIIPEPAYETSQVVDEISQMQLPHGRGELLDCLEKVEGLLKLSPEVPRKEVYMISDFQRTTWSSGSPAQAARIKALLKKIAQAGNLVLIDVGESDAANVAVTALESLDAFVMTARPARFKATIRNFGPERVSGRLLELLVDDKLVEQRTVDLNVGGETVENFSVPLAYSGERRIGVRLHRDALPVDDQRWLVVPVKDRIRCLCVSGGSAGPVPGKATDYLELALAPARATSLRPFPARVGGSGPDRSQIEPTVIGEGELQGFDLSTYDCVFFCNVRMFTEREVQVIEAFLKAGGGVIWSLGDQVSAENYNQELYRQGAGPLPARLGDRQGDAQRRDDAFAFDPGVLSHPLLAAFEANPDAGLETTLSYQYVRARPPTLDKPAPGDSRVALAFDSGDPAIVERAFGRGHSILITTSVDERWGTWPLWPSFLPLIHEIVQFSVAGRWEDRQRLVGESLSEIFSTAAADVDVTVMSPDRETHSARVVRDETFSRFSFENTSESGIYEVTFAHPVSRTELFAVNVDPRESNLAKFVHEEFSEELLTGLEFSYLTNWPDDASAPENSSSAEHGGLARWILYGILYLMFVEQMLAWDFHKGLWLLCPPLPLVMRLCRRV
jgi:hypothetical protein